MQVSTLGIMPPEMVPSAISAWMSAIDRSVSRFLSLSSTPGTSVRIRRRFAFSAPAMAPAKVSALTLKVPPSLEVATGASTGIISRPSTWLRIIRSTLSGSPTKPRSTTFSILESGSITVRVTLRAVTMLPSLPHRPMALPPAALIADDLLVDRAGQHHLDDLDGLGVGDAQPGGEFRLDAQFLQHVADLRPAAMDDD